ncbi:MAG TPA: hypothetical protein VFP71_07800 [Candidatus Angelobacter sp.]|nr:hypothetical protein [Candidatus Angelobacter sp.]
MKRKLWYFAAILFVISCMTCAQAIQAGTPEAALAEMATADNIDTLVKHFPVKVEEYMAKLPLQQRKAMAEKMLVSKNLEQQGGKLTISADGMSAELLEKEGGEKITITWKNTFTSGNDALVQLEIQEKHGTMPLMVGMSYENNEWRVTHVGEWRGTDVESELLPKEEPKEQLSAATAASMLRTLNTALITYATTYPDQGYPSALRALSGQENDESTQDHAMLVDRAFLQDPAVRNGYEFRYIRTSQDTYQLTATPLQFTEGSRSFFTDESAVIRVTQENRPATAQDPPLE